MYSPSLMELRLATVPVPCRTGETVADLGQAK